MTGFRKALSCAAALWAAGMGHGDMAYADERVPDQRELPLLKPAYPYGADAAVAGRSATTPIHSLNEAIALAYWTNPTLLAQRSTLKQSDALLPAARAAYGPQVTLQASHAFTRTRQEQRASLFVPRGTLFRDDGFASSASLILSQPLFSFGKRAAGEGDALARIAFGRDQLRQVESQIMLDVIANFASVIRDREALAIARENLQLLQKQYSDSGTRFRVREITRTDLQQVETRLELGVAQRFAAEGQLGASQSRFLEIIGALPGELVDPAPLDLGVNILENAYDVAEQNSPLIRAAQSREKVSRAALAAARAEQMPDVGLQGSGNYSPTTAYENALRTTEARGQVVVTVPLVDSGIRRSRIEQARQANDADWRLIDVALRETRRAVASAWDNYRSSLESLSHYRKASEAARLAYEGAVIQQKEGARTILDVLDLARDLLNVRTNYVTAKANEYIARATLLAAMGRLEAPMLVPDVRAYDPIENYRRQKGRGDIPLVTPILSGLDSATVGDLRTDRPVRDPAGAVQTQSVVEP